MSSNAFYFALTLPPQASSALLQELVARVCQTVSCTPDEAAELVRQVEDAVAKAAPKGECKVQFEAQNGALDIRVHSESRQIWQTSRPL